MGLSKREIIISLSILFVIALINFSGIFVDNYPMNDEDNNLGFAFKYYSANKLLEGKIPLWNNLFFTGMPFFEQEATYNPLNFMSFVLAFMLMFIKNPYFAYSLIILAQIFLMGWFAYYVSRRVFQIAPLASYFVAVIYMLNMGQMERVTWMTGGFVVAPLLILCADHIAKGRILFYSLLCALFQALGFYFGSSMSTAWAAAVFIFFLIYFIILKNGFKFKSLKIFTKSTLIIYGILFLLTAVILVPFIDSQANMHNLANRYDSVNLSRLVNPSLIKLAVSKVLFSNLLGFQDLYYLPTHSYSILPDVVHHTLPGRLIFGGIWNYWTILFYPLMAIFLFNIKSFTKKELAVSLFIAIFFIHYFLTAFNHITYIELLLTKGHNLFTRFDCSTQLIGGLFVGIVFNKILASSNGLEIKRIGLVRITCYPIIFLYSLITFCFMGGMLLYTFSKGKLDLFAQKIILYMIDNLNVLSKYKTMDRDIIEASLPDISDFITSHFFGSVFTMKCLMMLSSRLIIISLFILLLSFLIYKRRYSKRIFVGIALILSFFVIERLCLLKLYSTFNQDAPKNYSEDYKEIQYLKGNLKDYERVVVFSNTPDTMRKYLKENYGLHLKGIDNEILVRQDKERYYQVWKNFPESKRNGMPLMMHTNLPHEINTPNGLYADVPNDVWDIYHQINNESDYYRKSYREDESFFMGLSTLPFFSLESPWVDLIGLKYVLSSIPLDFLKLSFILRGDKYYLYENKSAFPRIWVVDQFTVQKDRNKLFEAISNGEVDLKKNALVGGAVYSWEYFVDEGISGNENLSYDVDILEYEPNLIKINSRVNKKSMLVLSDTYDKNWTVTVNGEKRNIERVNYIMRGVVLDPGENIIVFDYSPKTFFYSLYISIFVFITVCLYILVVTFWKPSLKKDLSLSNIHND